VIVLDQQYEWQGRRVRWRAAGSGPPVVFCHGTPWSAALWSPFAEALQAEFTVYLWDMPGYGLSSKDPEHDVGLDVQGRLFADLLGQWGLDRPHVIAHDYGGAVSLRAHLLHGAPYASLALVDVVALRPWGSEFFRLVREHADVLTRLPAVVHEGALRAYIGTASHRGLRDDELRMLTEPWLDAAGQAAFYRQIAQADERFTDEIEPRYGSVDVPVLVVWGTQDSWIPADRADRLVAMIPGARRVLIPDAGHLIQLDAAAALGTTLRGWLADVAS
jgi:pimeloyl-ACP methyl ester carboxylesterase